jgi:outer membrane protein OmpA-like peptidoglycan-associated protein
MRRWLFVIAGVVAFGFFLGGCATLDPFLYKEIKATDKAIEQARLAGADKKCPDEFQAVVKLREKAMATYKACRTDEAIKMAREAREKALALCPKKPIVDSDGDGVPDPQDKCPNTPRGTSVDSKGCPLDTDGDGVPDYRDRCPNTPQGVGVNADGCPLDSDKDGVYDYKDSCPRTPVGAKVDERGCWVLKDILFDVDKWEIKPKYYYVVDEVAEVLKKNPHIRVEIQGHTDITGSREHNLELSRKRAEAVMNYLIKKGISRDRLTAVGYGFSRPIAPNTTAEGRAKNRRVELWPIY